MVNQDTFTLHYTFDLVRLMKGNIPGFKHRTDRKVKNVKILDPGQNIFL